MMINIYCIFCQNNRIPILKVRDFMLIRKIFSHFASPCIESWYIIEKNLIDIFIFIQIIFFHDIVNHFLPFIVVLIARLHWIYQIYIIFIYIKCLFKRFFVFVFEINFNCNWKNVFNIQIIYFIFLKLYVWMALQFV